MKGLSKTLIALFITMTLIEIGYGMVLALLPVYLADYLGIGIKYIGIIISMFSLSELIAKAPGGWLADRIGRKPVLLGGIGLITLSFFLITLVQSPALFIPIVMLSGAGMAVTWPMTVAVIADSVVQNQRATSMGILGMVCLGGKGIGPALGSMTISLTKIYESPFYLNTALAALSFVIVWFAVQDTFQLKISKQMVEVQVAGGGWISDLWRIICNNPLLLVLNGILFAQALGMGTLVPIISLYANKILGISIERIGTLLLGPVIIMASLTFFTGRLADKIGRSVPIKLGMLLLAISFGLFPLSHRWSFLLGVGIIYGLGYALLMPAWTALVTEQVPEKHRGIVLGGIGTMQGLGFTLGPLTGTYLWESLGPSAPFYFCSLILSLGTVLAFRGIKGNS